jgi:hypothetical protein
MSLLAADSVLATPAHRIVPLHTRFTEELELIT